MAGIFFYNAHLNCISENRRYKGKVVFCRFGAYRFGLGAWKRERYYRNDIETDCSHKEKITELKAQLEELRKKDAGFQPCSEELKTREAEIEAAASEVTENSSEEDRAAVDAEVEQFDTDQKSLAEEQAGNEEEKKKIKQEISAPEAHNS